MDIRIKRHKMVVVFHEAFTALAFEFLDYRLRGNDFMKACLLGLG